jgi:hypothetical protein
MVIWVWISRTLPEGSKAPNPTLNALFDIVDVSVFEVMVLFAES